MAKHHPDLIMCRKQPGIGTYQNYFACETLLSSMFPFIDMFHIAVAAIGRLCEKCKQAASARVRPARSLCKLTQLLTFSLTHWSCLDAGDGKCVICDSYVRPATLVRICDECNYGSYAGRCTICGGIGISDAYYCKECTLQEKDVSLA